MRYFAFADAGSRACSVMIVRLRDLVLLLAFLSSWTDDVVAGCGLLPVSPGNRNAERDLVVSVADSEEDHSPPAVLAVEVLSAQPTPATSLARWIIQRSSSHLTPAERLHVLVSLQT
jgi:hypothetical protein